MLKKTVAIAITILLSANHTFVFADAAPQKSGASLMQGSSKQGHLGSIEINPYGNAPLTAIIDLNNNDINDVHVTIHGKNTNSVEISYRVSKSSILTHDGIPIFGLYASHRNQISVNYKLDGLNVHEVYHVQTGGLNNKHHEAMVREFPEANVVKVSEGFEERLYWINSQTANRRSKDLKWSNGGALGFNFASINYITDTEGEVRWILDDSSFSDDEHLLGRGLIMGVHQVSGGEIIFGKGQKYFRMDLMGRMIKERRLPRGYADFSHEIRERPNGNYIMRAAKRNYVRDDGQVVTTVRDHILEVDPSGNVVDVWDLNKILDPLRDNLLGVLNAGAVCLNVDDELSDEMVKIEPDAPFGDGPGVGPGRNWVHVNSIDFDEDDDSIIISPRHQATAIKIGRDKEVKWILGAPDGWTGDLAEKVLKPIDRNGNEISCSHGKCEGDFDWGWTQHTAWLNTHKGTLTVFDNGDARGLEQPPFPDMKYSRAVEYDIDEENLTVEQIWEYGKERGYEWYSPITSNTEYRGDKDTMFIFAASAGLHMKDWTRPILNEIDYKTGEVMVEIKFDNSGPREPGYRAIIIDPEFAFNSKD
ncbi:aryl-sulfate sulfotransferase [Ferrimonas pelagia]|uniref:Aryl-sulfate sulfotransferase n=1 Tax=Ferrimonas pelagia TaxID=1177826 RepID=A0ABP9EVN2_9GAMM